MGSKSDLANFLEGGCERRKGFIGDIIHSERFDDVLETKKSQQRYILRQKEASPEQLVL